MFLRWFIRRPRKIPVAALAHNESVTFQRHNITKPKKIGSFWAQFVLSHLCSITRAAATSEWLPPLSVP
jgi:hypothetical protein